MSKQPPPAPTASTVRPCPTIIQISRTPGTGSLPAPSHHPTTLSYTRESYNTILKNSGQLVQNYFQKRRQGAFVKIGVFFRNYTITIYVNIEDAIDFLLRISEQIDKLRGWDGGACYIFVPMSTPK